MQRNIKVAPSKVGGAFTPPASKSHTHRAIMLASLARGISHIYHPLITPDTLAMVEACKKLGAFIDISKPTWEVKGISGCIQGSDGVIQSGNSGIILRFLSGIASLSPEPIMITGDASVRNRPMQPLINALKQLGANVKCMQKEGFAPLMIQGKWTSHTSTVSGVDSQFVSSLLFASIFASQPVELHVEDPGELPWIDMTLDWMKFLNINVLHNHYKHYIIQPNPYYPGFNYTIPADLSTAAFPLAAAIVTKRSLLVENIYWDPSQGDKELFLIWKQMGIDIQIDHGKIVLTPVDSFKGIDIDMNTCVDALPIFATVACFASTPSHVRNVAVTRTKECDRIEVMAKELSKMGARIDVLDDGLKIYPSRLYGAELNSHRDHRVAMALTVAALGATNESVIRDFDCVSKTFPNFYEEMKLLGASFEPLP